MARKTTTKIVKQALINTVIAIGGWAAFLGIIKIVGLDEINPWLQVIIGLIIIVIATRMGLKK